MLKSKIQNTKLKSYEVQTISGDFYQVKAKTSNKAEAQVKSDTGESIRSCKRIWD